MRISLLAFLCLALVVPSASPVEPITTGSLVGEMVDLARLADFPDPPYKTVQFSSYDRRSQAPNTPGWFANSDGFGGERVPCFIRVLKAPDADGTGEYQMAELGGPGAIVRTWTAAIGGELRVFLDANEAPIYDGPAGTFLLDRYAHYARQIGLPVPEGPDAFRQRDANYFPIPFAKSCRIVWKGKLAELHFYHVQIRKYPVKTTVQTFRAEDLRTCAKEIDRAISILQNPSNLLEELSAKESVAFEGSYGVRQQLSLPVSDRGPGAIRMLALKVEALDLRNALRQTIIRLRFDDSPLPQVESPLGDFFGAAPGVNPYETLPMTVQPDGTMICRFVMPFARSVSVSFDNRGDHAVKITGHAVLSPYDWRPDRSMHFRARWRANHELLAASADGAFDLPFLLANGQGVYVGTAVMVMNPSPVPTAYGSWWGEGDEKVFVDGETFPSTFGTGSEDYFNYSWSNCQLFNHPYCAQPVVTGPDTRGYISNCRWHVLDALPFKQDIAFYMELYSHRKTPGLSYARIAYHYARPGIRDDSLPIMDCDARLAPLPRAWEPVASHGSAGAIFFQAETLKAEGNGEIKVVEGELWSGGKLLVWRPEKKGDKLSLALEVQKSGRYAIVMTATMTPQSGSFRASCDALQLTREGDGTTVDLRSAYQTMLRNFVWEPLDLKAGRHVVVLESANEGGPESPIGLDFIWLHPRK